MGKRSSQEIGADHERAVRHLLDEWHVLYSPKRKFRTRFSSAIELDFFLPATEKRPPVVLECKDFGVEAKNPEDSKRRKTQEALWLLVQVVRYCQETKSARIVLITGSTGFRADQEALLRAELGGDFDIVALSETDKLQELIV
jgi:hypothetical protein